MTDDEIRALLKAATPGPWRVKASDADPAGPEDGFAPFGACGCCDSPWILGDGSKQRNANAVLLAAAPDAFAEVLRMRGYLREIEREEKPTSNATVKRMAWVARAALKGAAQ